MKPSEFEPRRWRQIDRVFEAALETPAAERAAFLSEACEGDPELRGEVEALLAAGQLADARFESSVGAAREDLFAKNQHVGPFRLLGEIGRGGMGVVFLAEDTRLGRRVALKALPPYLGVGQEARERFVAEARAVSALDHPNIATLYEIGETEAGQHYMVFAYYEGETLETRIARGPLSVPEAVAIATGIAAGLAEAHRRGIVHRDVKPSNVLLTEKGEVKLLDFGVAKVAGGEITREGTQLGTIAYMSPEQTEGKGVDPRSDLWALGVVLYEMLAGERPFAGMDQAALCRAIGNHDPEPIGTRRADVPEELDRALQKLLFKDPDSRYASADQVVQALGTAGRSSPSVTIPRGSSSNRAHRLEGRRKWRRTPAILIAVVAVGGGVWLAGRIAELGEARIDRLAVLPLQNLTGDPAQQYFVDGIQEALIAELSKIGSLQVISKTSMSHYRDTEQSIPEIAGELGVGGIVEGSVFREGDSLAIRAQLIAVSPERTVWSGSFRRHAGSIYQVSSAVARSIADEIGVELSPSEERRLAAARRVNPEAYEAFVLGEFHLERRNREGFQMARNYYLRAIEIDSTFAPAYAGLATAIGSAAFFGLGRPSESMPQVKRLAESALELDPDLPQAHVTLAAVKLYWDWDWEGAERSARRAIAMNPSHAPAHRILSEILTVQGRYPEAQTAVERGSELDRWLPFSAFRPAVVLYYMGEFDQVIVRSREGLQFFPEFWQGRWLICRSLAAKSLYEQALPECEKAVESSGRTPMALAALGQVEASSGRRNQAQEVIAELESRAAEGYVGGSYIAIVYGSLGDKDRAFEWLERAYEQRDVGMVHLAGSQFDPLRSDPRFDALLRKLGLTPMSGGDARDERANPAPAVSAGTQEPMPRH